MRVVNHCHPRVSINRAAFQFHRSGGTQNAPDKTKLSNHQGGAAMHAIEDLSTERARDLVRELVSNLRANSHRRLRQALAKLNGLTEQIAREALVSPEFMDCLQRRLMALEDVLEADLARQEYCLFPEIDKLVSSPGKEIAVTDPGNGLPEALSQAMLANCGVQSMMEQVQMCLCEPEWMDKGLLVEELIDAVRGFEEALAGYVDLESEVLFPQTDELIRKLFTNRKHFSSLAH
jgi:iron-sulfur cluster repair protein YtfE (RIC family)